LGAFDEEDADEEVLLINELLILEQVDKILANSLKQSRDEVSIKAQVFKSRIAIQYYFNIFRGQLIF